MKKYQIIYADPPWRLKMLDEMKEELLPCPFKCKGHMNKQQHHSSEYRCNVCGCIMGFSKYQGYKLGLSRKPKPSKGLDRDTFARELFNHLGACVIKETTGYTIWDKWFGPAPQVEKVEENLKERDLSIYGQYITKDGERIAPEDFYKQPHG